MAVRTPALKEPKLSPDEQLQELVAQFFDDPLGFVLFVFPWGEQGTPLADEEGPDRWQAKILDRLGQEVRNGLAANKAVAKTIRMAVRSGHGVGKTCLVSWIIIWFIATRSNPQIVVTANTKTQLETKTWRELAKWHKLSLTNEWFSWTATKYYKIGAGDTWFAKAIPWSINNSEAFAGTHEENVLIIFDEASGIEDIIWETAEGAMTTPGSMWLAFGNSTRNQGRFRECFRKFAERWIGLKVDSRTARKASKTQISEWEQDYGVDSDFFRVRVTGDFPRQDASQFIGEDLVLAAAKRIVPDSAVEHAPSVLALDVARFGDDDSYMVHRKGQKLLHKWRFPELDSFQLAHRVMEIYDEIKPECLFLEEVGIGVGVYDTIINVAGYQNVVGVIPNQAASNPRQHANWRMEYWDALRKWLKDGGCPAIEGVLDERLKDDLTTPLYMFDGKSRMQLESKKDMKARGMLSPDYGDALALSFARPVASIVTHASFLERQMAKQSMKRHAGSDWRGR